MVVLSPARRVADFDDIEKAGDYCGPRPVLVKGKEITGVWFLLPTHQGDLYNHGCEGCGLHHITSPPWTFRECADGSLEIRASILAGRTDERPEGYWHGYLDEGNVWRQL